MITKKQLLNFINKYYLGGLNNSAKWRISDNTLTVYAGEQGKVCKIILKDFKFEDCILGVFDTDKLLRLINITEHELVLTPEKIKAIYLKLHIQDKNFDLTYSLADPLIFKKMSYVQDPEEYEIQLELDADQIQNLIKAKGALSDEDNMTISTLRNEFGELVCEFTFGDSASYSNKIAYRIKGTISVDKIKLPFNSQVLREILKNNKDMDSCKMCISAMGLMKINFLSSDIEGEYYILRNE